MKGIIKKCRIFVAENRQVVVFILKVAVIYAAWKLLSWFLGEEKIPIPERHWPWLSALWEHFNDGVRICLLNSAKFVFTILGYSGQIISDNKLLVPDLAWVGIGDYCLGIQLWIFFVALICSYPGKWKHKLLYALLGVIAINSINILRLVLLIFAFHAWPKQMQFNHDYIFNVVVYIFTFGMWVFIVKKGTRK